MKTINTTMPKKEDIVQDWHFIDVSGKILGRVASDIATLLIGKNKAGYMPHINVGDKVVVTNSSKIAVSGNKLEGKVYKRVSQYPGSVKEERLSSLLERRPNEVIRRAVKRMLPQNKLIKERINNLYIYADATHPHTAQINNSAATKDTK